MTQIKSKRYQYLERDQYIGIVGYDGYWKVENIMEMTNSIGVSLITASQVFDEEEKTLMFPESSIEKIYLEKDYPELYI